MMLKLWNSTKRDRVEIVTGHSTNQPLPLLTRVVTLKVLGVTITAVMRHWRPGDSGRRGRCQLCRNCSAYSDGCLVIIAKSVTREEAALLTLKGTRSQGQSID
ncbi:hypothetical protein P12x_003032 [Tundrisphaera lichenicola]|uniref:hypothetical protein n=1 Tax=Tundrisphaera lichenicola TaxID=2029860 RepID=UPI003EBBED42